MTNDPIKRVNFIAPPPRSILLNGLRLLVTHPGALVWTYLANLVVAMLFSLRLHAQLSSLLDHSLAAQRLNAAFDVGVAASAVSRLTYRTPSSGAAAYAGLPLYFLVYFLLVPGALAAFRLAAPARLGLLLSNGVAFFWRFVRITLLTILVSGIVLGPLFALQGAWAAHVEGTVVGVSALYRELPGILVILLVAAFLRLYFDLVEVYTIQIDSQLRANGKRERRVRKTLLFTWKTIWRAPFRSYGMFVFLAVLGFAAFFVASWFAVHTLAQARVWPTFLLFQLGLFVSIATRYWQRAAETILVEDDPIVLTLPSGRKTYLDDPLPNPEPASPSLVAPDTALYHHSVQPMASSQVVVPPPVESIPSAEPILPPQNEPE